MTALVATPATYEESLVQLLASPGPHYVVFSADLDPASGLPWCPDCQRSLPGIKEVVASAGGTVLEVRVGDKPAWKSPDHPYRHAPLGLKGIPTLVRWTAAGAGERITNELEDAPTAEEATAVAQAFVQRTSGGAAVSS